MTPEEARQEAIDALVRAKAYIVKDMPDRAQAEAAIAQGYALLAGQLPEEAEATYLSSPVNSITGLPR